jgi:DNA-binding Lrp family transcriptional regulator
MDDLDRSILEVLDQNRENGITVKGIFNYLKDFFEDLTKGEINQRLYFMKKEGVLKFSVKNRKERI